MPLLGDQTETDVPENLLSKKLDEDWLPNDPKPRVIVMTRQSDGKWTVKQSYD